VDARGRRGYGNYWAGRSRVWREKSLKLLVDMLYYSLIFLLVALVAAVLGFAALAGLAATIAKVLFVVFLVFFIVALVRGKKPKA
jgi:uncharacterized membrane protein YtjA (UPF0391 family)